MKNYILVCFLLFNIGPTYPQLSIPFFTKTDGDTLMLKLEDAINIAGTKSLDALVIKDQIKIAHWQYKNFKADLLPSLIFDGSAPNLNTSISSYLKEDGTYDFIKSSSLSMQGGLFLTQNIPFTGGQVSVQSQIQRIEQLDGDRKSRWLSIPIELTYVQPIITARPLYWSKKIEPQKYREAKQQFGVNMEAIAIKTIQLYFDLLLATVNSNIAEQNYRNSIRLYEIARAKREHGLISENDMMQLELGKLNAKAEIVTRRQDFERKMANLRIFLNIYDESIIIPEIPEEFPMIDMSIEEIRSLANKNNPLIHNVSWKLLEAQRLIAQAKIERGFQLNLFMSLGYTGTDSNFSGAYKDLQNRQVASLGIRIPILDWGKGKGRVQLAESQAKVEKNRLDQQMIDFDNNIFLTYNSYKDQEQLTIIAEEANKIAQKRYQTVFETFRLGRISVLDINMAQNEQETARRNYINQLYASWLYYYSIRQITLFDFKRKNDIINNYEGLK
ncbi:TolC family protein [Dysgonomonas sp. Marseille-P4677]|uniref:TolC family protein n=1 Tax=Dysgonomonas sp. Marseille-P4677 TaxID=2364790 RepID=UPI0019133958|nr:TolC family protein [Dysgonomonas sp. Marseille-P4677]MBK5722220.1 TolC family protein [Dysgonomonas sp. Marseille-P4677]